MTEERRVQLVAEVDTTRTQAGFQQIGQQAGQMAQAVTRAGEQAERAVSNVGSGATTSTRSVETAQRSIIASIQRTTTAMEAGGRQTAAYYELMGRQRGIDPAVLAPYIAQLRAVEQAQARTAASAGASAGQIAAAMRTVPAQVTDIVTALQGGQRPLTVLLQQGGQLRDQFGSTGTAARALASYVTGLINPYTVLAGAAIGLAVAYKSGAEEAAEYAKAIALTGNAAGATADQLNEMARQISAVSGNRGDAAEAITALTATGQVSVDNLKQFGAVAAEVQKVIGRSVADTAAEFAELGRAPLTALDKINEKYHFITAATYEQVKALQDQGKASEAAEVAQKAYADGIDRQRQKVMDSLTDWERGWIRIKGAISGAVDATIDFAAGRGATGQEKIKSLLEERSGIEENMRRARARGLDADVASYKAELDANERAINAIREKGKAEKDAAKSEADAAEAAESRIKWLKEGDKYLGRTAQLERDVTRAQNEGAAAKMSQADIDKRVADIRKSYADLFNAGIDSNIEALKRRDQVQDVLTQREVARIAAQRSLGSISEADAINQTADAEDKAFARHRALLEGQLALARQKANSIKEQSDLEGQIDVIDAERTNRKKQRENEITVLQQKRLQASEELYNRGIIGATAERDSLRAQVEAQFQYNQEIGLSTTQVAELKAARLEHVASLKEESAAALEAIDPESELAAKYREQAQALRDLGDASIRGANKEQRVQQWKQAVDEYGNVFRQGFADMLNNGEAGWHSFTKSLVTTFKTSVADQIYKMFARPFVVQMVGSFLGISGQAIAGEIASQPNAYGVTSSSGPIGAAQAASKLYDALKPGGGMETSVANGMQSALEKMGVSSGTASTAGQYAGQASGILGGYALGSGLNSAISGKYETGSGFMTTEKVATAVASAMFGPIGGAIAGGISGLVNRAFGMGPTEAKGQGLRGTLSASSLTGTNYADYHQDGGWFRSDKNWTDTKAFSADMVKQFTQGLGAIESASSNFAQSLGVSADSISSYSKTFDIKLTGDQAKDQQAITDFFNGVGDEIAKKLIPTLDLFSKSGESASAALQRLSGDFQATTQAAQLIGKTAVEAFGSAGIASASARERLVELAGGGSNLVAGAQSYGQNFLTDEEKLAPVAKALDEAMASLGLSSVTTRDQFKAVVNGLDLTTDAGAKEFISLMQLSEAFAQVHPATDAASDAAKDLRDQLDELTLSQEQLEAKRRDQVAAANRGLYDQVQGAKKVKEAQEAAKTSLSGFIDRMKSFATTAAGLNNSLVLGDKSTLTPEQQYAEARKQFEQTRQAASAGDVTAQGNLQSIEQTFLEISQKLNGGDSRYSSDLAAVMRTNDDLSKWAQGSVDVGQASLDALTNSNATLSDISSTLTMIAKGGQLQGVVPTSVTLPDYSRLGAGNTTALVDEIKALRASNEAMASELKGLRADQHKQTGDMLTGFAKASIGVATTLADGLHDAMTDGAYAVLNSTRNPK
jgi:phage-related minor tail protein